MASDIFDAALELVHETEQMLKVVLLPNAYGWSERHEGVNSRGRQFIAAWNEVRRLWDPDLEGRLAGRRTDAVAFHGEVLAGCWLRVAKDVGLRVLAVLQRLHETQLGRPLVLNVRPTPRAEPEAPILAFSAEHVPAIVERVGQEPAFTWQEPPEKIVAAIRRDFTPLIVGIRQEQAWAGAPAPPPATVDPPADPVPPQYLGDGRVRIGGETVCLEGNEADIVETLVILGAANIDELRKVADNVPRVLNRIREKYPLLAPHIISPGAKGRGGYRTTIVDGRRP